MRALVLVGGEGTRLRPLTLDSPKQLLPVAGKTMLEWALEPLARYGVEEVVLSLGYRPDAFMSAFPDGEVMGMRLRYAVEPSPMGTAGAMRFAAEHCDLWDDRLIVCNGDVLADVDIAALLAAHERVRASVSIALAEVSDPSAYGVVVMADDGRVERFVEKPPIGQAPSTLVNAGVYLVEPSVLREHVPVGRAVSVELETFPILVASGGLYALECCAYWLDAGTPEKYLKANLDVLSGSRGLPPLEGSERVGSSWVAPGGPLVGDHHSSLFLEGCVVEAGASVSCSVLGQGSRVCEGAVLARSVLLPGAVVGAGATVEDSVVGRGGLVGAGSVVRAGSVLGTGAEVKENQVLCGARLRA